jgi:hypothetical protein
MEKAGRYQEMKGRKEECGGGRRGNRGWWGVQRKQSGCKDERGYI